MHEFVKTNLKRAKRIGLFLNVEIKSEHSEEFQGYSDQGNAEGRGKSDHEKIVSAN
jgi:hypothetical protein